MTDRRESTDAIGASAPNTRGGDPLLRKLARILIAVVVCLALAACATWAYCLRMPGRSFEGAPPAATDAERALAARLEADVRHLCAAFPERNWTEPAIYAAAADWVEQRLHEAGFAEVARDGYTFRDEHFENLVAVVPGSDLAAEIVVVGAHYDAIPGTVGADDNASGVAALLALAERVRTTNPRRTVRFVAFANEEPPHFQTGSMGSLVHARRCRERGDDVVAMLSFDGVGFYSDDADSQSYPEGLGLAFPSRGNFVAIVGDASSRALLHRVIETFRAHARIPSEGAALPADLPGVGWSDHWSFWQAGYRALEITDTLPFRYAHYHAATDTPDRLDYVRAARVVLGVEAVVRDPADR